MNKNSALYAFGAIALGIIGFVFHDFARQWQAVPDGIPMRMTFVYLSALLLLVGLSTLVMILVWDTGYRLTGIICLCVFYSLAAAFCGVRLKAAVFDESTPFHATLEELANDRERLLP